MLTVRKVEERGAIESAHRVKQICGQVFRFAVAESLVDRDVTADLKGAVNGGQNARADAGTSAAEHCIQGNRFCL